MNFSSPLGTANSCNNVSIRLSPEQWKHICDRHPEMASQGDRLLETIGNPEYVQKGDTGELLAIRHYSKTPLTSKYLVVVYRELNSDDGFILTAYFTRKPSSQRKVIWKS